MSRAIMSIDDLKKRFQDRISHLERRMSLMNPKNEVEKKAFYTAQNERNIAKRRLQKLLGEDSRGISE